jgi:hypothetical protein
MRSLRQPSRALAAASALAALAAGGCGGAAPHRLARPLAARAGSGVALAEALARRYLGPLRPPAS